MGTGSLSVEEWESIHESQWKTTTKKNSGEFVWKGAARLFFTPDQIK